MTPTVLRKINIKLKFLIWESIYLIPAFRRLLCNALIQAHFHCACSSWFPVLKKNLKSKLQTAQNKYIYFRLNLPPRSPIDPSHFRKIKLHPARQSRTSFLSARMELYRDIHEMFKPSFLKYSVKSLMPLDIPL